MKQEELSLQAKQDFIAETLHIKPEILAAARIKEADLLDIFNDVSRWKENRNISRKLKRGFWIASGAALILPLFPPLLYAAPFVMVALLSRSMERMYGKKLLKTQTRLACESYKNNFNPS